MFSLFYYYILLMALTGIDSLHKIYLVTGRLSRNIPHAQASVHVRNDLFQL